MSSHLVEWCTAGGEGVIGVLGGGGRDDCWDGGRPREFSRPVTTALASRTLSSKNLIYRDKMHYIHMYKNKYILYMYGMHPKGFCSE